MLSISIATVALIGLATVALGTLGSMLKAYDRVKQELGE